MRSRIFILAIAAFALALALRVGNAPVAVHNGIPQLPLLDDLYHFKRIAYTAASFPRLLDFDPDRGVCGAFCPWGPLYDFAAGTAARFAGARTPPEVLDRIVWLPPLFSALFVMLAALLAARVLGMWPAAALTVALASSPFLIAESSIGDIDHHFLEAALAFAIVLTTLLSLRPADARRAVVRGIWLGLAIGAALLVRPSLLIAAALSFLVLFVFSDGLAAACGFSIAAIAVVLYRVTRLPGYPESQWFLGWSHAALLGAAAVSSMISFLVRRTLFNRVVAFLCGTAVVLLVPTALPAILFGSEYLGGNPWFRTIVEGQVLWNASFQEIVWRAGGLSVGAFLVWFLMGHAWRNRDPVRGTVALYAAAYLVLTISNVRYWSVGIPLLALAACVHAATIARRPLAIAVCVSIAVVPAAQFALWRRQPPEPVISAQELPWLRAALFLHDRPGTGRVLAPWSMGHAIDVIGHKPVIMDNFGIMTGEADFDRAHEAFLQVDDEALLRYCRETNVQFIVLDNPLYGLQGVAAALGLDRSLFVPTSERGEPYGATRLARATWWWRAYYGRGPFPGLRLIYVDPQPSWEGTAQFRGPAVMIWERPASSRLPPSSGKTKVTPD